MLRYAAKAPKVKVNNHYPEELVEIYNANEKMPEFAILAEDGRQICTWMKCKDYIQDTIWGTMHNKPSCVYGWNFTADEPRTSLKNILLALRWRGKTAKEVNEGLKNTKRAVENLEKKLGIPRFRRTRFSRVQVRLRKNARAYFYFIIYGSQEWMRCKETVSFFTWLIRANLTNPTGDFQQIKDTAVSHDFLYLTSGRRFIGNLLVKGIKSFPPNWDIENVEVIHNNGFCEWRGE